MTLETFFPVLILREVKDFLGKIKKTLIRVQRLKPL